MAVKLSPDQDEKLIDFVESKLFAMIFKMHVHGRTNVHARYTRSYYIR